MKYNTKLWDDDNLCDVTIEYDYFPKQTMICYPDEKAQEYLPREVIILGAVDISGHKIDYSIVSEEQWQTEILDWVDGGGG